jgi:hypothetical protein
MYGFEPTTAELVETYKPLLVDPDEAVRNSAAQTVLFEIQTREGWKSCGGGTYSLHKEDALRRMLEVAIDEKRVTAPAVVEWLEKGRTQIARITAEVNKAFEQAMAQTFTAIVGEDGLLTLHYADTESAVAPEKPSTTPLPPNP